MSAWARFGLFFKAAAIAKIFLPKCTLKVTTRKQPAGLGTKAAGVAEAQATAKKVSIYLTSDVYAASKPIRERALKALTGEASVDTVEAAVAMFDLMAEDKKQKAAEGETAEQKETPGQQTSPDADLLAKAATLKINVEDLTLRAQAAKMDPVAVLKAEIANLEMAAADRVRQGA